MAFEREAGSCVSHVNTNRQPLGAAGVNQDGRAFAGLILQVSKGLPDTGPEHHFALKCDTPPHLLSDSVVDHR